MVGVLVVSHGLMAKGIADAVSLFFGDNIEQFDYLGLEKADDPFDFGERISKKIDELDTGDGVYILSDLFGGTPCNQSLLNMRENVEVIAGINLGIVIELLTQREFSEVKADALVDAGRQAIKNAVNILGSAADEDDSFMS